MAKWLDQYEQGGLVLKKKTKDNYGTKPNVNDVKVSAGPNFVGEGYTAYNWKSPAWGGQFQMGGSLPGTVGFMYARTQNPAPSNGKYAKKTQASAQNGKVLQEKRHSDLYSPIENKIGAAIKTYDEYYNLPGSTQMFIDTKVKSSSYKDNRNIPPIDPIISEVQQKIKGLSDQEVNKLLNTNWSKMGIVGAMKNAPTNVSYPEMLKYINHFNKLKKKGYTFQNGGEMKYYQDGLDFKPKSISQDGRNISKELKKEAEEKLKKMNKPKATISQYTPKAGEAERLDKEKLQRIEDSYKLLNRAASSKGAKNLLDAGIFAADVMGGIEATALAKGLLKKAGRFNLSKAATTVAEDDAAKAMASSVVTRGPIPAPYKGTTLPYDNIGYKEPATGELAPYLTPEFETIPYSELPKTMYHGGPSVIADIDAIKTMREGLPIQSATSPTSRGFYTTPNTWMRMEGSPNPLREVEGFYDRNMAESAENYAMGRGDAYIHAGEFVQDPRIVDWKTFSNLDPVKSLNPDFRRLSPEAAKVAEDLGIYGLRDKNEYNILNPQKAFKSFKPTYKNLGKGWERYAKGGIVDPMGQWAHPGEVTTIPSNDITMKGVDYDVLGVSDTGDTKLMKPGKNYKFKGNSVTEYPKGGWLNKYK